MSAQIPTTMKALISQPDKTAKVESVPVPEIGDDEVLVKVVAVALNPTDWFHIQIFGAPGMIAGCDYSGTVVKVGRNVSARAVGEHVAGFAHGGGFRDRGAFAEYLKTDADLCWPVPARTLSHEQAAAMGCGYWTAAQTLFHPDRLGLVEVPNKVDEEEWVLIYGGSGSVGLYAIQLAHLAGYKVVTTASPRNHALCRSLGADAVVDYNAPDALAQVKALTHDSIRVALDAISEADTQLFAARALAPGGQLVTILAVSDAVKQARPDVAARNTLVYTSLGRPFVFAGKLDVPASAGDRAFMVRWLAKTPALVSEGKVRPNPTKLFEGGLEGINDGLKYMQEGKHSGQKIVYRIAD
ncbi:zinc-binding alcohol dehydrogenase family protein [Phanerochaete sordida]|uniref:Zinc-binding alcohol dehydrogenase family protein n=1 Tax=Phanerochaete sordida TaxID=48140 RepID=A0A9P3L9R4_9APHY|nr:zinc-binding alcohol dehydrogenase family protein [Phanerochaete sordida]